MLLTIPIYIDNEIKCYYRSKFRCPMIYLACRECNTHPNGFVRSSAGLITPGMCTISMSFCRFQSWMTKKRISMCLDLPVGFEAFTISIADALSSYIGVGSICGSLSSDSTDRMNLAVFAAVTAAMSSASVELRAVML